MQSVLTEDFEILSQSNLAFEQFRDKKILITGATGLIGSLLVKTFLYCNHVHQLNMKVYALVRNAEKANTIFEGCVGISDLTYVIADLEKDELYQKIQIEGNCDFIIHAAAVTTSKLMVSQPVDNIKTAVNGTDKMLKFAVDKKCSSFVYISSMEIYGQPFTDVPFYWSQLKPGMSLAQNINQLFFSEDGNLRHEFEDLYDSLFKQPKPYLSIVDALATKKVGMTRTEILRATKLTDNGKLTEYLENLEYCGFIRKYNCIGMKAKNALFQLMDNYTLFYYKFIKDSYINDAQYWTKITGKPEYNTWCGLAFERVCLQHVEQIKAKLGIQGVITTVYSWSVAGSKEKPGAQIDLLIDRNDDVINLCEIKYSKASFQITNTIDASLQNKQERFIQETGTEKAVHLTMITTMGLSDNPYAWDVQSVVTMDDLFVL